MIWICSLVRLDIRVVGGIVPRSECEEKEIGGKLGGAV